MNTRKGSIGGDDIVIMAIVGAACVVISILIICSAIASSVKEESRLKAVQTALESEEFTSDQKLELMNSYLENDTKEKQED